MATIRKRSGGYNVQIRKQGYSTITKTFSSITTARKWAAGVEADIPQTNITIPACFHAPEWLSQDL